MFDSVFANVLAAFVMLAAIVLFTVIFINTLFRTWGEFFFFFTPEGFRRRQDRRELHKALAVRAEQKRQRNIQLGEDFDKLYANIGPRPASRRSNR